MDEELEKDTQSNNSIDTQASEKVAETNTNSKLANLPRREDLIKSEQEVKVDTKIQGVEEVDTDVEVDRTFAKKSDQKRVFMKKRLKVVTGVYISVVALLMAFVGVNLFAIATMNGIINDNTYTIATKEEQLDSVYKNEVLGPDGMPIEITLNPPRDYSDDTQELTFFDKISILFRNLFS